MFCHIFLSLPQEIRMGNGYSKCGRIYVQVLKASCSVYPMINGVIWAGISAGSNQAGAIVTCRAKTTSPLGSATTLCTNPTVSAVSTHHTTRQAFIIVPFHISPRLPLVLL